MSSVSDTKLSAVKKVRIQYEQTLLSIFFSCSNATSDNLLKDVWNANSDLLGEGVDYILEATDHFLKDIDTSHMKTWKTALSKINPIELLEKTLPICTSCINEPQHTGLEILSNMCKCDLGLSKPRVTQGRKFSVTRPSNDNKRNFSSLSPNKNTSKEEIDWDKLEEEDKAHKSKVAKLSYKSAKELLWATNRLNRNVSSVILKENNHKEEVDWNKQEEEEEKAHKSKVAKLSFKTAKEQLWATNPAARRALQTSRRAQSKFISPMRGADEYKEDNELEKIQVTDEKLKHIDPKMIELIESEIIDRGTPIGWDDIAGLQLAKSVIQEAVVWPLLRPDLFTGLRRPPKGILLFGPPGTGKTLIGKCVAAQSNATFFSISASSLTSKWIGDGEKMVRALFAVARCHQPAVIFIDEIDSLLCQRNETEHEATRRIKTEFLVQFDGVATGAEDRVLIVGATNRPQELDEAARRRLVKRLYIPLPDQQARAQIISNLLKKENNNLTPDDMSEVARLAEGYSGADMESLCSEAAMGPIRAVPPALIATIDSDKVRPVCLLDFNNALQRIKPSVSPDDLVQYVKWNSTYGQGF